MSFVFFLMIRRPPRSTLDRSSAASDVYKRQRLDRERTKATKQADAARKASEDKALADTAQWKEPVSYTHLRAHETVLDLVCRLLLEKKNLLPIANQVRLHIIPYSYTHHTNEPTLRLEYLQQYHT